MELPASSVAARQADLHYVDCRAPGIRRTRRGKGFRYVFATGSPVTDKATLARIRALVIPPAWQNVWICPDANGHLQATGIDARGRKQYRYHNGWTAHRNLSKFAGLADFARALPSVRRRIKRDLALPGMPREKVLACIVHLLDQAHIRIGNDEYAKANGSYGLTTIRNRHAKVRGDQVRFCFRAKSGKPCDTTLRDAAVARIVRKCQDLPGQELFAYLDQHGHAHDVTSTDVNEYLSQIAGARITAKDFRTWGGTIVAAETLLKLPHLEARPPGVEAATRRESATPSPRRRGGQVCERTKNPERSTAYPVRAHKHRELTAIRAAAAALCNTVATCRKFYVHPDILRADEERRLQSAFAAAPASPRELSKVERAVAVLLRTVARRANSRAA